MEVFDHGDGLPPGGVEVLVEVGEVLWRVPLLLFGVVAVVALAVYAVRLDAVVGAGAEAASHVLRCHVHHHVVDDVGEFRHAFLQKDVARMYFIIDPNDNAILSRIVPKQTLWGDFPLLLQLSEA